LICCFYITNNIITISLQQAKASKVGTPSSINPSTHSIG